MIDNKREARFFEPLFIGPMEPDYGFGVGVAAGSSPRFLSFGGPLDELLGASESLPVASGLSGCRFLSVGRPVSPPSSKSTGIPAFALVNFKRWPFTR